MPIYRLDQEKRPASAPKPHSPRGRPVHVRIGYPLLDNTAPRHHRVLQRRTSICSSAVLPMHQRRHMHRHLPRRSFSEALVHYGQLRYFRRHARAYGVCAYRYPHYRRSSLPFHRWHSIMLTTELNVCAGDARQRRRMVASVGRLAAQPPRSWNMLRPAFRDVGYVQPSA